MANPMEDGGFTLVSNRKGKQRKNSVKIGLVHMNLDMLKSEDSEYLDKKLGEIQGEIIQSEFYSNFKKSLVDIYSSKKPTVSRVDAKTGSSDETSSYTAPRTLQIVCYGLGTFSSCFIALYQLGFLIILKKEWNPDKLFIYEPRFSEQEISYLKKLDFDVLEVNEHAARTATCDTIFFMPHCDMPLYNNLLCANWSVEKLQSVIIIGNSFSGYKLKISEKRIIYIAYFLRRSTDFVTEVAVQNDFKYDDIFNDLSIHFFKTTDLQSVSDEVWNGIDKSRYAILPKDL